MNNENDDVIAVEAISEISNMETEKPLMGLLNRLIGTNNKKQKQNTVLTNAQIQFILEKEFDVSMSSLHSLEQVVYMNIVKKYLKLWPLWDDLDIKIKTLKHFKNEEGQKKLLENIHSSLKTYIKRMLDVSEPIVKLKIKEIESKQKPVTSVKDSNDVIMELLCSRSELHTLFLNRPTKDGAIFNITPSEPSRIRISHTPYKNLLNWWGFSINITFSSIQIRRETCHKLKHVLVNKKLFVPEQNGPLSRCFQEKPIETKQFLYKKEFIQLMQKTIDKNSNTEKHIGNLLNIILDDLKDAPSILRIPGLYRQHMSAYSYVRYLCTDVNVDPDSEEAKKYDIQLQETISPMFQLWLGKVQAISSNVVTETYIECKECMVKFSGIDLLSSLEQHFLEVHINEPNWTCVHCKKSFQMFQLTDQRWSHSC